MSRSWGIAGLLAAVLAAFAAAPVIAQPAELRELNRQTLQLYAQQDFKAALPVARRALAMADQPGVDPKFTGTPLNNLASVLEALGRYAEAEPYRMRVVGVFERELGTESPDLAVPLAALGMHYQSTGQYRQAAAAYKRGLDIKQRANLKDDSYIGHLMERLGSVAEAEGKYEEAELLYKNSLAANEKILGPDHLLIGNAVFGLASVSYRQGRGVDAEALYRRALDIFKNVWGEDHYMVAKALNNLGLVYADIGRNAEAERFYKEALEMRERVFGKQHFAVAETLNNLAVLYSDQGKFADAEPLLKRDIAINEKSLGPEHADVAIALDNLARLYADQAQHKKALPLYERSLTIREKTFGTDSPDVAASLNNMGYVYLEMRAWAKAYELFRRSLEIRRHWSRRSKAVIDQSGRPGRRAAHTFVGLAKAGYRVAEQSAETKRAIADQVLVSAQWNQETDAAASLAQMSARLAKGDGRLATLARERQDLAAEWRDHDRALVKAASQARDARDLAAEERTRARLAAIAQRMDEIDLTLAREFPEYAALASPEPLTSADIQKQLRGNEALIVIADTPDWKGVPEETFVWVVTREEVRWLKSAAGAATLAKEVAALRCGLDATAWNYPQDAAGDDAELRAYKVAQRAKADQCLAALGAAPGARDDRVMLPFDTGRAHKLYQALLGEVAGLIKGRDLLVVPSGALAELPFHALVSAAPPASADLLETDFRKVAWLARDHAITVLPAVSSLKALRSVGRPSSAAKALVGFGNPLLDGPDNTYAERADLARKAQQCQTAVPQRTAAAQRSAGVAPFATRGGVVATTRLKAQKPLPETADELCAVARALGADTRAVYLGKAANEAQIKRLSEAAGDERLANYRILHFATHGTLAGQISANAEPGLILTPPATASEADDGYLSASEIATLKLDADWAILSACNTAGAAGGERSGEALSGLARAFFYAQARALLVSHWEVDSEATVKLITTAVGALDGKTGRAAALQKAMLALIDTGAPYEAHPATWAPFVVVGEGAAPAPR